MQLERRGIPSVLIGTDRFRSVLEATRRMCGIDEVQWAEVPHPLGSLVADELRARAELAVTQFEAIVLRPASTAERLREARLAQPG